jgi:hypothetical protein
MFTAGTDSANAVASSYDVLTGITLDSWRDQAAYDALRDVPASATLDQAYEKRIQALERRAGLARQLAALYTVMTKSGDAAGLKNISTAGAALGTSLQGLPSLPGATNLEPDAFGQAAQFFVDLKRRKDLLRGLKGMQTVLTGMQAVFERESPAYARFSKERNETAAHLLALLSEKKIVNPGALLKTLPLGVTISARSDEQARAAGLAIAKIDVFRATFSWDCATRESALVLAGLSDGQKQAVAGTSPDLRDLRRHIGSANGCLAEYKQIAKVAHEPTR